jgi:hypothetical protein
MRNPARSKWLFFVLIFVCVVLAIQYLKTTEKKRAQASYAELLLHINRISQFRLTEAKPTLAEEEEIKRILERISQVPRDDMEQLKLRDTTLNLSTASRAQKDKFVEIVNSLGPGYEQLPSLVIECARKSIWNPLPQGISLQSYVEFLNILGSRAQLSPQKEEWQWEFATMYFAQCFPTMPGVSFPLCIIERNRRSYRPILSVITTKLSKGEYTREQREMLVRVLERFEPGNLEKFLREWIATEELALLRSYALAFPDSELTRTIRARLPNINEFRPNLGTKAPDPKNTEEQMEKQAEEIRDSLKKEHPEHLAENFKVEISASFYDPVKRISQFDQKFVERRLLNVFRLDAEYCEQTAEARGRQELFWWSKQQPPIPLPEMLLSVLPFDGCAYFLTQDPIKKTMNTYFLLSYKARFAVCCALITNFVEENKRLPRNLDEAISGKIDIPESERALYRYEIGIEGAKFSLVLPEEADCISVTIGNSGK